MKPDPRKLGAALLGLCLVLDWSVFARPTAAEAPPAIIVTSGSARTYRLALQEFADRSAPSDAADAKGFRSQLLTGLEFSGLFDVIEWTAFLGDEATSELTRAELLEDCDSWRQIGADAFVEGRLERSDQSLTAQFQLWDTASCRKRLSKRYRQLAGRDDAILARRMADDIVENFTGVPGVSDTEIVFVSTRTDNPEIYVMNATGESVRSVTSNGSINLFPSWTLDGIGVVYTSYRHLNRPYLFLASRSRQKPAKLLFPSLGSERHQYRGVFDPSGRKMAIVVSAQGPAEIYTINEDGSDLRRLTNNRSIDVSPAWSPDGEQIAFVSDRSGSPQIYVMGADGSQVRRLTFDGSYNTAPAWSPDGAWIAYEARVKGQFDIWLLDVEGGQAIPLISHPASDEGPSWAPNSRKIVFSSRRRGRADLYVVDINGDNLRRLTRGLGDNTSPAWGKARP
ncbi:hypothetical protein MK489_04350 [Myxococcota bacterium]|nr:hypothetical protein [Myxococcota bacterium]